MRYRWVRRYTDEKQAVAGASIRVIRFSCKSIDGHWENANVTLKALCHFCGILASHPTVNFVENVVMCTCVNRALVEIYQWEGGPHISQGFGTTQYKRCLFKSDFTTRQTVVNSIMNALVSLDTLIKKFIKNSKLINNYFSLPCL